MRIISPRHRVLMLREMQQRERISIIVNAVNLNHLEVLHSDLQMGFQTSDGFWIIALSLYYALSEKIISKTERIFYIQIYDLR